MIFLGGTLFTWTTETGVFYLFIYFYNRVCSLFKVVSQTKHASTAEAG